MTATTKASVKELTKIEAKQVETDKIDKKNFALEIDAICDYVSRETIEVCVNQDTNTWAMAVFLQPSDTNNNDDDNGGHDDIKKFDIQILNQDEIVSVDLESIRKFKGCSDMDMFVNLVNLSMGAGIFSLPWALAGSSIIPGLIFIFLSMIYVFITCAQILESADRYNYDNIGKILEKDLEAHPKLSQYFKIFGTITCWISTILCLIGYYIVIYDNGGSMFPNFTPNLWFIIGPAITSVLTFLPNRMLSWTSFISLIVTIMVIIALIIEVSTKGVFPLGGVGGVHLFSIGRGYFCIIATIMMSMSIQYNMPSLYKEVQIRDVKRTIWVMGWAFAAVYTIFSITVVLAYFNFGPKIEGNFLKGLPNTPFGYMVKAAAMLVCMFVAPICVLPITDDIELWINTYRLKKNSIKQEEGNSDHIFGSKDIEAVDIAGNMDTNVEEQNENMDQKKDLKIDIGLRIIKIFAIASPGFLAYISIKLGKGLDVINIINGVIVLFCYCAITPLIVTPKLGPKDYALSGFALIISVCAAYFTENYTEDLDWFTPNW
jgi:amino acid permease